MKVTSSLDRTDSTRPSKGPSGGRRPLVLVRQDDPPSSPVEGYSWDTHSSVSEGRRESLYLPVRKGGVKCVRTPVTDPSESLCLWGPSPS